MHNCLNVFPTLKGNLLAVFPHMYTFSLQSFFFSGAKFWSNNILPLLLQMCAAGGLETICTSGAKN